ncbi:hypothetical protein [Nocardia sp. BMG111209]|nr:hypothetical protein [Nocardia sp. BMG111209]
MRALKKTFPAALADVATRIERPLTACRSAQLRYRMPMRHRRYDL